VHPPGETSRPGRDRAYNLDTLFEALKIAPDNDSARAIEQRIWALWIASGSDTCNLLMGRVKAAIEQKDLGLAMDLARDTKTPMRLASLCDQELTEAMARGWAGRDASIALTLQEERAGIEVRIPRRDAR